ncbi:hypothetical protein Sliba_46030 [Streptomyces nigrescens]|uniref:Uncharacterized protein n=1 Tax=Streptomyces nigrescens TaxID=1920 RepID=A0A640TLU9_STRNI|nr:hypothetical protein Sliba_46030 [Streptomyces libani subsp. libani]GGW00022.1 hypothetical protein GCM10010500_52140 [Streptomyces libani subsp. libani]
MAVGAMASSSILRSGVLLRNVVIVASPRPVAGGRIPGRGTGPPNGWRTARRTGPGGPCGRWGDGLGVGGRAVFAEPVPGPVPGSVPGSVPGLGR